MGLEKLEGQQRAKLEGRATINVFKVDNTTFKNLGELQQLDSLIWRDSYRGLNSFQLFAPITDENALLIQEDHILWIGGEVAAVIESIKSIMDKDGIKSYQVKGRTLEKYLEKRIIWGTYIKNDYPSNIMRDLVNINCINPTDSKRKIPWLILKPNQEVYGTKTQYQQTGGSVYNALMEVSELDELGFNINFFPKEQRIEFEVTKGIDRTRNNGVVKPVEFSTQLDDILQSIYFVNSTDTVNMALVAGEENENTPRVQVTTGDLTSTGFNRLELYVDARDLQSTYFVGGNQQNIPAAEYQSMLKTRGNQKIGERAKIENFEATIRVFGQVQYEFGVDYEKGDLITMVDDNLMVSISARITQIEEGFGGRANYSLLLTFGYSMPTAAQQINKIIKQS